MLGKSSLWVGEEKRTERLLGLLGSKTFSRRREIPHIIATREPLKGNQLLLRFLTDPDPEVRDFCVIALQPLVAAPPEIEAVIGLLDDPSHSVRFQSRHFLERATGHVTRGKPDPGEAKAAWKEWLRLRYSIMESTKTTVWEDEFHLRRPEMPLAALRATIAMSVNDLESESSEVRSLARSSMTHVLEDSCPFRMGNSGKEAEWLNKGIALWWENRIMALQE